MSACTGAPPLGGSGISTDWKLTALVSASASFVPLSELRRAEMPNAPILTLDDLEPERPTIAIHRNAPDGPWQAFKHRHFDWLQRLSPVRYVQRRELYPLRLPSEFGLQMLTRMDVLRKEVAGLASASEDPAAMTRVTQVLREMAGMVLDAPAEVIDHLSPKQHGQII